MKKVLLVAAMASVLGACTNNPAKEAPVVAKAAPEKIRCMFPGTSEVAPKWVCTGQSEGLDISATGISNPTNAGPHHLRDIAVLDARSQISAQLSSSVSGMVKSYSGSTGLMDAESVDAFNETVKKSLAHSKIEGSRLYDFRVASDGRGYALVGINAEEAKRVLKKVVSSSKNGQAIWQKLEAEKAFDEMEAEIKAEALVEDNKIKTGA